MTMIAAMGTNRQPSYRSDDERWTAVVNRDHDADGAFYYSVRTTGVYCRPSCGSRRPRRQNVEFHATREAAERAGFRPCRRCRPDQAPLAVRHAEIIACACRRIERAESMPALDELASEAGMSRFYFHRVFKQVTGVTPRAYAAAHRTRRVQRALRSGPSVTAAIYEAGYNSDGRFYADSPNTLGMKPSAFKAGGRQARIRFAVGECSLGSILVAATDKGVCSILLGDDPAPLVEEIQRRFPQAEIIGADREFERMVATVVGFVETPAAGLDLPLDIRGTAFQQRVWQALRRIPAGATASYSEIARRIGAPKSARAVAQACGANRLAVAIPCHRVVRNDGSLSGYRWGVERKRELLARERRA